MVCNPEYRVENLLGNKQLMKCSKVQGDTEATNLVRNPEYIVEKLLGNRQLMGLDIGRSCLASIEGLT